MSTLTDRYTWAVVRLLPEDQRPEIEREVRSLVAEMVDSRSGEAQAGIGPEGRDERLERQVLVELGDPSLLAARYVEHPRSLISSEHFPEYLRVLKLVAVVAVPAVTALSAVGAAFGEDPTLGSIVGSALVALFNSAVQVAFWVTLVYAFAPRWKADDPWTPDDLPDVPAAGEGVGVGDTVFGIVVTLLAGVAMVWQHVRPPLDDGAGVGVPVLHPDLWVGPGQLLLGILAVSVLIQAAVLVRRGWSEPLAVANAVVNLAFLGVVTWAALGERLINTAFLELLAERGDWAQVPAVSPWVPIVVVAAIEAWDSAEAFVAAHRAERRPDRA